MKKHKIKNSHLARVVDMVLSLNRLDVPVYAANAAYFIILAAFPTVMLLLNLLSYTSLGGGALLEILEKVIPSALMPSITRLLTGMFASSSKTLVSVSALQRCGPPAVGFSACSPVSTEFTTFRRTGAMSLPGCSAWCTPSCPPDAAPDPALHVFGQTILAQLPQSDNPAMLFLLRVISSRFLVLLLLQTALFTAMFMFLPNRRNKFLPSLPGALLASLGWQLFSDFFSLYVEHFSNFSTVYGSLSAVAIAMLWLYTCVAIVFYGGALNKYLADIGYQLRLRRWEKGQEREC